MRRSGPLLIVLLALAVVAVPTYALGATRQVVADCNAHGSLAGHYSSATLRTALATLPTDEAEYTNCADVIRKQLLAQVGDPNGSGPSSGGSGGSFLPTWVIVLLVLVVVGGGGAAIAARRRGDDGGVVP